MEGARRPVATIAAHSPSDLPRSVVTEEGHELGLAWLFVNKEATRSSLPIGDLHQDSGNFCPRSSILKLNAVHSIIRERKIPNIQILVLEFGISEYPLRGAYL
eukprot:4682777-Pyramimonas_sp.AAC.1